MTRGLLQILAMALVGISFVSSQDIAVQCGKSARNTVLSDAAFKASSQTILPNMKKTVCDFGATPYCDTSQCVLYGTVRDGDKYITIAFSSDFTVPKEGGSFDRGPCTKTIVGSITSYQNVSLTCFQDKMLSQCIDGSTKVSSASATAGKITYQIHFGPFTQDLSNEAIQSRRQVPDSIPFSDLPAGLRSILQSTSTTSTSTTTTAAAPTPTVTLGGGTPNTANCQSDVDSLITNLNANYGDTIDLDRDQSKMADFVRGPDNKGDNDWWRLTSFNNVFLVFGKDAGRRGFSDDVGPIQKSQLIDFINQRKLFCKSLFLCM
jgi:hypothetical protein